MKKYSYYPVQTVFILLLAGFLMGTARQAGAKTVLNAAPAKPAPAGLLDLVDVLIVNETELSVLSGASLDGLSDRAGVVAAAAALRRRPSQR